MDSGTGWVFGALLGILAIALVIAGATGHGTQLFQGITGKATSSTSSQSSSTPGAGQNEINLALSQLAQTGNQAPQSSGGTSSSANPYAGLGNISGVTV